MVLGGRWSSVLFSPHYHQESLVTVLGEAIYYALLCCVPDNNEEPFAPARI